MMPGTSITSARASPPGSQRRSKSRKPSRAGKKSSSKVGFMRWFESPRGTRCRVWSSATKTHHFHRKWWVFVALDHTLQLQFMELADYFPGRLGRFNEFKEL